MIKSVAEIKKACAITNFEAGVLSEKKKDAIVYACAGQLHDTFSEILFLTYFVSQILCLTQRME